MKNTEKSRQQVPSSFDEANVDIGAYFARKKQQKSKKVALVSSCFQILDLGHL